MSNNIIPLNINTIKSTDELLNMYKQGHTIDAITGNIIDSNGNTVQTMLTGTESITFIGMTVLSLLVSSLIHYKVGKWTAKKLHWD